MRIRLEISEDSNGVLVLEPDHSTDSNMLMEFAGRHASQDSKRGSFIACVRVLASDEGKVDQIIIHKSSPEWAQLKLLEMDEETKE